MTDIPTHITITILDASAPQIVADESITIEPEPDTQPVDYTPKKPTGGNAP